MLTSFVPDLVLLLEEVPLSSPEAEDWAALLRPLSLLAKLRSAKLAGGIGGISLAGVVIDLEGG